MKNDFSLPNEEVTYLLSPKAVREKSLEVYQLALAGKTHFSVHEDKLPEVSEFVLSVIKDNYPDLEIPFHSRWGHFEVGGKNRVKELFIERPIEEILERARSLFDLVVVSVLLDAGAGMEWKYTEDEVTFSKSEGLAVASFHMFKDGLFSQDGKSLEVNAEKLQKLTIEDLQKGFQVSDSNPLIGIEGRLALMHALGKTLQEKDQYFKEGRPGDFIQFCQEELGFKVSAETLLHHVLLALGPIWPGRLSANGIPLGDVWNYSHLKSGELIPFHKLSQWLTYSLIHPIEKSGIKIENVDQMTGLPEYRNGGLLLDTGLISLRDASNAERQHSADSELIIEWRALTVSLLDKIADNVRTSLGKTSEEFPLGKVLEGGTWWAGRRIAKEKRSDGGPPLNLLSDGTVF